MKMYQVSTLQALMLGYTNPVVTVAELLEHGNIGLGTFKNIDGEMIVLDGVCYRAKDDGNANLSSLANSILYRKIGKMADSLKQASNSEIADVEQGKANNSES